MGQFTRFPQSLQNRSTFCRRFPSVGERAMKAIPAVALSALIAAFAGAERASAASAAGRTFDFTNARPMLEVSTDETIAIAIQDRREYVVDGGKPETFVGLIRSRVGIPFDVHTTSTEPLATDLGKALVATFAFHKVTATYVRVAPEESPDQIMSRLGKAGAQKALVITLLEWRTDTYQTTRMDFQFRAELFDASGRSLARHAISGSEALGRINASQVAEKKLSELLRGPISSALQGPKAADTTLAAPRPAGGSLLMQQVQCKVGEDAPAPMTLLACSQRNGEVIKQ